MEVAGLNGTGLEQAVTWVLSFFILQDRHWTPLHQASQDGDVKVVSELIDSGANVDAKDKVSIVCIYHTEIHLYKFLGVITRPRPKRPGAES